MKKLLILLAAGALAVCANAATVTWGSSAMTLPSGGNAGTSVSASLFIVTESVYNSFVDYSDAAKLSDAVYEAYGSATATKTGTTRKNLVSLSDGVEYSSGDKVYAVLLYTVTENGTAYWMGNYGMASIESLQDVTVSQMGQLIGGSSGGGSTATAWSTAAVPEPTSGLLLLLGMAGLALKHKRA